jgi:hypothetical protein
MNPNRTGTVLIGQMDHRAGNVKGGVGRIRDTISLSSVTCLSQKSVVKDGEHLG